MAYLRHGSWRQTEKRKEKAEKEGRQPVKITRCALWIRWGHNLPDRRVEWVRRITWKSNHSNPTVFNFVLFVADFKILQSLFSLKSLHRSDWTAVDVDASRARFTFRQRGFSGTEMAR
jgi:hypothetical protein